MMGVQVLLVFTKDGQVESTAYVNLTHPIYVRGTATLVLVSLNYSSTFLAVYHNGSSVQLPRVSPTIEKVISLRLDGRNYTSQEVVVNSTLPSVFNVSLLNHTNYIYVAAETDHGFRFLNDSQYFLSSGRVFVINDPVSTYFVVYSQTPVSVIPVPSQSSALSAAQGYLLYVLVGIVVVLIAAIVYYIRK